MLKKIKDSMSWLDYQIVNCPLVLVCMCHCRMLKTKINRVHERALRITYNNHNPVLNLYQWNIISFTIHEKK